MKPNSRIKFLYLLLLSIAMPFAGFSQCGMSFTMISQNYPCNGDCTQGSAAIAGGVTGGTSPYTYLWDDPGATTNFFIPGGLCGSLAPGTPYTITVTDNTGCDTTATVFILEPTPVVAVLTSIDACFNECNGQVILGASGGGDQSGSPYDYIFENTSTTTTQTGMVDSLFIFSNLCPGTYNITITEQQLLCSGTNTIVVNEASDYTRSITSTDATCFNKCDGTATVTMGGSQPPYTYSWAPSGGTSSTATGLCGTLSPGTTYTVNITDALGCVFDTTTTVSKPPKIVVNLDFKQDPSCPGFCDGVLQVSATGGTGSPPYTFNWSSGQSASTLANLCASSYTVTVTDGNGCDTNETYTLVDQTPMTVTSSSTIICTGGSNSTYVGMVDASGGTAPYTYQWDDPSTQTNATATGLLVNTTYTIDVTDSKGCQAQTTEFIEPLPCPIEVPNTFSPNGDGINDTWEIQNLSLYPECKVKVYNRWGDVVFKETGYDKEWKGTSLGIIPLPFGVYYYVIEIEVIDEVYYGSVTIVK